jgi:hypothetical protein
MTEARQELPRSANAAELRDRLVAALLAANSELLLARCDERGAELVDPRQGLSVQIMLVERTEDASALRKSLAALVTATREGGLTQHFVAVGGDAEVREALAEVAPLAQEARMGFHHLDPDGALARVRGHPLPLLVQAGAALQDTAPLAPHALAGALARGASSQTALRGRLLGYSSATRSLATACVALFALSYVGGLDLHPYALYRMGAASGDALRAGEPWRLLASAFLHADPVHLALNLAP